MKKSVAAYGLFAASFVLVSILVTAAEAKAQLLDRSLSLRDLATQLKTPEDIAHYLWRHFTFESDQAQFGQEEYWQSPEEFLANRKGDCEDFALFAHEMLKRNGIQSFLMNVYSPRFAHTVCVFKEKGRYNVIDGSNILRFEAENIQHLSFEIYPFWKEGAIVAPSSTSNEVRLLAKFERLVRAERRLSTSA